MKTRLNASMREQLVEFAGRKTDLLFVDARAEIERLKAEAVVLADAAVTAQWSTEVLTVLDSFDCVQYSNNVPVLVGTEFTHQSPKFTAVLSRDFRIPRVSGRKHRSLLLPADHPLVVKHAEVQTASTRLHEARSEKLRKYKTLVAGAKTFEDVVEMWPEAEELRSRICGPGTAIATITPAIISGIKQDMTDRVALANEHETEAIPSAESAE